MNFRQFAFNNVMRNKRIYIGHFLSSTFAVMIFFTYGLLAFHPDLQGDLTQFSTVMNSLGKIGFQISQYLTYFFSIFFIMYSVSAFLKKRKREFGVLMILGISPRQLIKLVFIENIFIGLISSITGIGIGLIFAKLILLISASVLSIEKGLTFYFPIKAILTTASAFIILFFFVSVFISKTLKVSELVELIKSEEKPKDAPNSSIWLSLLSIILIASGYVTIFYFNHAIDHLDVIYLLIMLLTGVILVVTGTYYFFTQLSVYVLRYINNNENLFFRKTNILTISELTYRLKDNAQTFFLVAVISAVSFTAIGTSAAFGDVVLEQIKTPYAISYSSAKNNPLENYHVSEITKELEKADIKYKLVSAIYQSLDNGMQIMRVTDYNQYAKNLGYKAVTLSETEGIVIKGSQNKEVPQKKLSLNYGDFNESIIVKEIVNNNFFGDEFSSVTVVSESLYNQFLQKRDTMDNSVWNNKTEYGFIIDDWQETKEISKNLSAFMKNDSANPDQKFLVSFLSLDMEEAKGVNGILLILTVLVGIVFFVFAASFLYFRLFTDLEKDRKQYRMLSKIGLHTQELKQIITRQMGLLFFLPMLVAIIHSIVAFSALQQIIQTRFYSFSIVQSSIVVLGSFVSLQVIYFIIIRRNYLNSCTNRLDRRNQASNILN